MGFRKITNTRLSMIEERMHEMQKEIFGLTHEPKFKKDDRVKVRHVRFDGKCFTEKGTILTSSGNNGYHNLYYVIEDENNTPHQIAEFLLEPLKDDK